MTILKHKQAGFSLIQIAIILLIAGLFVGAVFSFISIGLNNRAEQITVQRQQKIAAAIAAYTQMHYHLPCPGMYNNVPNSNFVGEYTYCDQGLSPPSRGGIVPFRLLGLKREDIFDGYGTPFIYSATNQATFNLVSDWAPNIEAYCRTSNWMSGGTNKNPQKAHFCCPSLDRGYYGFFGVYKNNDATELADGLFETNPTLPGSQYANVNTPASSGQGNKLLPYAAYALVSHGKNKDRSITLCPNDDMGNPVCWYQKILNVAGAGEITNGKRDANYGNYTAKIVDIPRNETTGNTHFDDIVLWRTQDQVMSELGNDSCAMP